MEIMICDRQEEQTVDVDLVRQVAEYALIKEQISNECELSITFVSSDEIANLNEHYRGIKKTTDILSFSIDEPTQTNPVLGDIVISPLNAKKNAKDLNLIYKDEISFLIIHGILHLLGYTHKENEKAEAMGVKEQEILDSFKREVH